ncbi:MAG: Rrf2 family transcriptional regulator [Haloferacaceae archaeon]
MVSVDSSAIELTDAQKVILTELLNIHSKRDNGPVKGKEIAAAIDRNPGTIRTQMQSLKSLQLVKGIPGPKGGYEPTAKAYEVIDLERSEEFTPVPISREGEPLTGVTVTELDLINLHHPDRHEAEVYVQGSARQFREGDPLVIGPTPAARLVVTGTVDGVDASENICVVAVDDVHVDSDA